MSQTHIITPGLAVIVMAAALIFSASVSWSCMKAQDDADAALNTTLVTFSIPGVQYGDMPTTKGTIDDITEALLATRPTATPTLTIKLTSDNTVSYSANVGAPIAIPYGTYRVTATYTSAAEDNGLAGSLHRTPCYSINQVVTITEETTSISLSASYTCFAIVLDTDECSKYQHTISNNTLSDISIWNQSENIKIVYIKPFAENPVTTSKPYRIKAFPNDTELYAAKEYPMITASENGYLQMTVGKWYKFSPKSLAAEIGEINIGLPEWEQYETQ